MGYPYGLAPREDGTGTSPADLQRILGSRWANPGVIAGCRVTGRTDMTWQIGAGAVVVMTGAGLAVEVPVESIWVAALPAPATGTRRDYIYVTGNSDQASLDAGNVRVSSVEPSTGTVIATVRVPAGATTTAQMGVESAVRYALPVGASLGVLAKWDDPAGDQTTVPDNGYQTMWSTTLPILPTDRLIEVEVTQCVSLQGDRRAQGGMWHRIMLDGVLQAGIGLDLSFSWSPKYARVPLEISGQVPHTISYLRSRDWHEPSSARPAFFVTNTVRSGVRVWDRGAVQ